MCTEHEHRAAERDSSRTVDGGGADNPVRKVLEFRRPRDLCVPGGPLLSSPLPRVCVYRNVYRNKRRTPLSSC